MNVFSRFFMAAADTASQAAETAADGALNLNFEPGNFVANLSRMGIGMLVIFVIIGVIILTTMGINKLFSRGK